MIDGQPAVEPTEVDNSLAQTAQTEGVQETDENVPEKFRGKSKSDIAQSYVELENKLGTQGTQLTELQQQLGDFQRQQQQAQYEAQQRQQTAQPAPSQFASTYYDDPVKATEARIQEESQKTQQQMRYAIAYNSADNALNEAKRMYPDVFKGMDGQELTNLKQGIMQTVGRGGVAPEILSSPDSWASAAMIQRGLKTGFKFGTPGEVSANPTESPASVKSQAPPAVDYTPDEKTSAMMRKMGLTKEQQTEAVKRATTEFERYRR